MPFREAQEIGMSVLEKISDPFLKGAAKAIFQANPPQLGFEAFELAKYCVEQKVIPFQYWERLKRDVNAMETMFEATNAAHKALDVPLVSDMDAFLKRMMKMIVTCETLYVTMSSEQ